MRSRAAWCDKTGQIDNSVDEMRIRDQTVGLFVNSGRVVLLICTDVKKEDPKWPAR
jgi:hypothetical protein